MDLSTVKTVTTGLHRSDLDVLSSTVVPLAGGSELFADPRATLTGLVDLQGFEWPDLTVTDDGLIIGATCTVATLSRLPEQAGWAAHPLVYQCCTALYGSFKVWNVATVGGNLATSLPAGPMTALAVALDAEVLVWRAGGIDEVVPAHSFVTGDMTNVLAPGDVVRSLQIPLAALQAHTVYRQISLSPIGRSGALLIGRLDADGSCVLTVTAATLRPVQLRYPALPTASVLAHHLETIDCYFTDAHGAADWRAAMSVLLGEEIRTELAAVKTGTPT